MVFDRKTLVIPDETKFEEKLIITKGDIVIGDRCLIRFGIKTEGRIFVGEHAIIDGDLDATDDIRADIFTSIGGNVKSGGNVYLGEKVKVKGKLSLKGDLDVGDSVDIEKGFEAKGWINIRSPIPMVIYIFIYLTQLLKMGHSEEIERILKEIEDNNGDMIPISETFLFIPNNSIIGIQKSKLDYNMRIGKKSIVLGNYDIKGNVFIEDESIIKGTIRATGDIFSGKKTKIEGNIESEGDIKIEDESNISGDISSDNINLSKKANVKGKLIEKKSTSFTTEKKSTSNKKVKRFENDTDVVDEVENMLE